MIINAIEKGRKIKSATFLELASNNLFGRSGDIECRILLWISWRNNGHKMIFVRRIVLHARKGRKDTSKKERKLKTKQIANGNSKITAKTISLARQTNIDKDGDEFFKCFNDELFFKFDALTIGIKRIGLNNFIA